MKILVPILAFSLSASLATAQEKQPVDLLNRRLTVSMPKGSHLQARSHSVMAAPNSNESETRVVFEDGDKKLVLMARELFSLAGKDYQQEVPKALEAWSEDESTPFDVSCVGEHLTIGTPQKPNDDDDAILYAAAFVRHKDDSIQRIGIYFNPEFHQDPERCAKMAAEILASLKIGERTLHLAPGERRLGLPVEDLRISLTVPQGWIFYTRQGPDFLVHHLQEVVAFGSSSPGIGIYIGGHPGYHHERIDEDDLVKEAKQAPLFGKPREWIEYSSKKIADWKSMEIISSIPQMDDYWKTHIFTGAKDDKSLEPLLKIIATAKIEKTGKPTGER